MKAPNSRFHPGVLFFVLAAVSISAPVCAQQPRSSGTVSNEPAATPGYMGARLETTEHGIRVRSLVPGAPAEAGGLRAGDIVETMEGVAVTGPVEQFTERVRNSGPGAILRLRVLRGTQHVELRIHLTARPAEQPVEVGVRAPELNARLVRGQGPASLTGLRGRVVVLDFFASWCGPCRLLMPALDRLNRSLGAQGLTVLGVTDEDAQTAQQLGLELGVQYPLAVDDMALGRFHVSALPTTIVVDRGGVIRRIGSGTSQEEVREIETLVRSLLAEPVPTAP